MIRSKPTLEYSVRGTIFGIDSDGRFDMALAGYFVNIGLPQRLRDTELIEREAEPNQVLLTLRETEVATFRGSLPLDTFAAITAQTDMSFFRIRAIPETGKIQYASIPDILKDSRFQTSDVKQLVDYIPYEQLDQLGVACLKRIIK